MGMRHRRALPNKLQRIPTSDELRRALLEEDETNNCACPSDGFRDSVFVALTMRLSFSDEEAKAILSAHPAILANYEERRFEPFAAARAVLEYV